MYNTKFILQDGMEIYPGYLDKEKRQEIKAAYEEKRKYMWCGCKSDNKLYYRISEDLKIYPEHKHYKHDKHCSRYRNENGEIERQTAYMVNEENGEVTVYTSFNPRNFELKEEIEIEANNIVPDEDIEEGQMEAIVEKETASVQEEKKEPKLSLPGLIRSINVDAFTEKVMNEKYIESRETFSKFVYHRLKKVRISRMQKAIGELTLEKDGVRFIYVPVLGAIKKKEKGLIKCYIQTLGMDGKVYNNFIFAETLEKVVKDFKKTYGIEPDEYTMLAGFQYLKKSRSKHSYRVLGRVHMFQISDLGIYCRNLVEQAAINSICEIVREDRNVKFWIPPEDEGIGGVVQVKGIEKKRLILFPNKKDERVLFDSNVYDPLVIKGTEDITKELLYKFDAEECCEEEKVF